MKSHSLSVILFLLSVTLSYGQVYLGFFTGTNLAKLSGDVPQNAEYKNKIGLNTGAFLDFNLTETTILSLQPSFSQEGTKIFYLPLGPFEPVDSISIRLNYFSLPVLVKILTPKHKFYAITGIETAYLLNYKYLVKGIPSNTEADIAQWNVALHFGAGVRIPAKHSHIVLEFRYTQGIFNLTDETLRRSEIPRVKTSGLKLFLGFELPLSKKSK